MIPDKHPKEEFFWLGIRFTPGAVKTVLWVAFGAAGAGLVSFWDQIAQIMSLAPVAAFIALIGMTCFTSHNAAYAAVSPEATMAVFCLAGDYDQTRKVFQ